MFDSLRLQLDIVGALAYRIQSSRIRASRFGAIGLLVEPLIFVVAWLTLRIVIRSRGTDWMNPVLQFGSGFILFYLFRKIAFQALKGVSSARQYAQMRRIQPLDVLLARSLVESQIYGTCLLLLLVGVSLYEWRIVVGNPGATVGLFVLMALTSLGVGLSALVLGHRLPIVKEIVKLFLRRLLFWTSGLFFSIATVPDYVRPLLLWNPLLHGIELFRHSMVPTYPIPGISLNYLIVWAFGSLSFGMFVYGNNEQLLVAQERPADPDADSDEDSD